MTLFFESYSVLQIIVLFNKVRKADEIYFHSGSLPFNYRFKNYTKTNRYKSVVIKLIRLLNKDVKIQYISREKTNEYNWESNKDSVSLIDTLRPSIEKSATYKINQSIINDKNLMKYYQHYLAQGYIANKISFIRMANDLFSSTELLIIPCEIDFIYLVFRHVGNSMENREPFMVRLFNMIQCFIRNVKNSFILFLFPILFLIKESCRRGITFKKVNKCSIDILQKVAFGFSKDGIVRGKLFKIDDGYLFNNSKGLKNIGFMIDRDTFVGNLRGESKRILLQRGIPVTDIKNHKITTGVILASLVTQTKLLLNLYRLPFLLFKEYNIISYISCFAIYDYLKNLRELEYVEGRVAFCRDDANADHIIRTIISNKRGNKTVGMQHGSTAGPYVMPQLCYVHFDRYCVYSHAHLELHLPYWQEINIAKTGSMFIDNVVRLSKNKEQLNKLKDKMSSLYKERKFAVLISFPTADFKKSLLKQWDEMYNALCEFKDIDIGANIFLRFRGNICLDNPHVKRFTELCEKDDRIIIDHTNFTTYEIMALCDLFISNSHSSGMIEAVAMGKKAFTFDYRGTPKYCFSKYGKDLILWTKEDVLNVFKDLENNFEGYDCNWELLRKEYNYHYDGRCLERIQQAVKETLDDVTAEEAGKTG